MYLGACATFEIGDLLRSGTSHLTGTTQLTEVPDLNRSLSSRVRGLEIRDRGTAEVQGTLNFDLHAVWLIIMYCEVQGTLNFTCRCTLRVDCVRWLCTLRVGGARCARCHARKVARRGWRRKGRSTSARKMWRTRSSGRRSQPPA